jgi:hypothetical protein
VDRTNAQIVYDLLLDEKNERIVEMKVTLICPNKPVNGAPADAIVFLTTYRFSREGQVEKFNVPADAAKLLK